MHSFQTILFISCTALAGLSSAAPVPQNAPQPWDDPFSFNVPTVDQYANYGSPATQPFNGGRTLTPGSALQWAAENSGTKQGDALGFYNAVNDKHPLTVGGLFGFK